MIPKKEENIIEDVDIENVDSQQENNIVDNSEQEILAQEEAPPRLEPKIPLEDGGKAIFILGKFLQNKGWIDDAMFYFRHALYLCLLECDVDEPQLMDETQDFQDGGSRA